MAKGPGKSFRKGLTLAQLFRLFPDDAMAEKVDRGRAVEW